MAVHQTGRDLRTLWPHQGSRGGGYKRTINDHGGPKAERSADQAQALAAARGYVPTEMLTKRKPPEEDGHALQKWLGLGSSSPPGTPSSASDASRSLHGGARSGRRDKA